MNESYETIITKLGELKKRHPTLSNIWLNYIKEHQKSYLKALNSTKKFVDNVDKIMKDGSLTNKDVLILYLILNNDINI